LKPERNIKVLVAEDHTLVRRGIVSLLSAFTEISVIAEAENGRQAVAQALALQPDVVLMDIGMPLLNGLEATSQIKLGAPDVKIIALSAREDEDIVRQMIAAGASGYLLKTVAPEELREALREVAAGHTYFAPGLSPPPQPDCAQHGTQRNPKKTVLSGREREILQLIAEGKNHRQIAQILNISIRTVDTHRNNIIKKLDLHDTAGLVLYAIRQKIVILPQD